LPIGTFTEAQRATAVELLARGYLPKLSQRAISYGAQTPTPVPTGVWSAMRAILEREQVRERA
jgi:hypothetical protein